MRNHLFATVLVLATIVMVALVTVSGSILLVATPFLLYLLGSWWMRPQDVDLEMTRRLSRDRANPDEPIEVTITVTNHGSSIAELVVTDELPPRLRVVSGRARASVTIAAGAAAEFRYSVVGPRGSYRFGRIVARIAGDLPQRSLERAQETDQELVMLPNYLTLARIPIAPRRTLVFAGTNPARQGGEGTEFYDMREHRSGESLRHVNWRASARHPDLLFVNEFQQERVADVAILLDCRARAYPGASGASLFDAAATAAASLSDVILDAGNRVGYLGYGTSLDWLSPGFGKVQKHRVLNRIARAYRGDSQVFTSLGALPERLFPMGSQVILVTPLTADDVAPLERLIASGYAVMVVALSADEPAARPETPPSFVAAARLARLHRAVLARRVRHAGIALIEWRTSQPFENAVAASLGGIVAAWRWRRR